MKYQMGLSNSKCSEAAESNASVMVEVKMCEVESGGMRITGLHQQTYLFHLVHQWKTVIVQLFKEWFQMPMSGLIPYCATIELLSFPSKKSPNFVNTILSRDSTFMKVSISIIHKGQE